MIVTLTKLFVINIVANVRSVSCRSAAICLSRTLLSGLNSSISCGERLKKAISLPLANPDNNSNVAVKAIATTTPILIGCISTNEFKLERQNSITISR